jgi:predicted Rossmann fold nucleotide-binding protein DprA/Smf involved in DNA uptake
MTDIRAWALAQQADARRDLDRASARLAVLSDLLKQLPEGETAPLFRALRKAKQPLPPILKRLQEAGEAGMSAKELAVETNIPIGTASARLSNLRTAGVAANHDGRYFALHSSSEDNNVPQGGEAAT